jgi:hypothetical protein
MIMASDLPALLRDGVQTLGAARGSSHSLLAHASAITGLQSALTKLLASPSALSTVNAAAAR